MNRTSGKRVERGRKGEGEEETEGVGGGVNLFIGNR